jgi:hypothetical protein
MKHKAPQFDLPGMEQAFNLAGETTIDGDALIRDLARKAAEAEKAHEEFRKRQRQLFGLSA